jgi:hypothetical protein
LLAKWKVKGKGGCFQNFRCFFFYWEDDLRLSNREVLLCVKKLIAQSAAAAAGFDLFGS